jgi:hypothetical protein
MVSWVVRPNSPTTFKGNEIGSVISHNFNETGSTSELIGEGKSAVSSIHVFSKKIDVTLTLTDLTEFSSLRVGETGALVLKAVAMQEQGAGRSASVKTLTFPEAVVTSVSCDIATSEESNMSVSFSCGSFADESYVTVA